MRTCPSQCVTLLTPARRQLRTPELPVPSLPPNHMFQRVLDLAASPGGPFRPIGGADAPQATHAPCAFS